jgi:L-serine dehydratase
MQHNSLHKQQLSEERDSTMRFKDVFSIIGPAMVGPSSSHTAGAVRLGRVARRLLAVQPEWADIRLYGSFADTYKGHGTDLALIAGLLDYEPDDPRVSGSLEEAERLGMRVTIRPSSALVQHPNTAMIHVGSGSQKIMIRGASIGGGNIELEQVNGFDVRFSGSYPTLLVFHADRTGVISDISGVLTLSGINIGYMDVDRKERNGDALTVVETDGSFPVALREQLVQIPDVQEVRIIDWTEGTL